MRVIGQSPKKRKEFKLEKQKNIMKMQILILAIILIFFSLAILPEVKSRTVGPKPILCSYSNFGASVYESNAQNCVDSDKGMKPCVIGEVSYEDATGNQVTISDSCTGQFFVSEFTCSGNEVLEYNIGCKKECVNGVCT